jgi:hypothetical protein
LLDLGGNFIRDSDGPFFLKPFDGCPFVGHENILEQEKQNRQRSNTSNNHEENDIIR